eukprot:11658455-Alexandrium_andersonii.AAC.1
MTQDWPPPQGWTSPNTTHCCTSTLGSVSFSPVRTLWPPRMGTSLPRAGFPLIGQAPVAQAPWVESADGGCGVGDRGA